MAQTGNALHTGVKLNVEPIIAFVAFANKCAGPSEEDAATSKYVDLRQLTSTEQ
jgi:hypothetical protein